MNRIWFFFRIFSLFYLSSLPAHEKIYAIMITGKDDFHFHLAENSITSFLEQTYSNKELIIINDGNYNFSHIKDDRIREIHLNQKFTLGKLRNIGLDSIPHNAIWIQWDDDDWHHPNVIEQQYNQLIIHCADMCAMTSQIQYCFRINSCWKAKSSPILGTIMCRNKKDIRYPKMSKGEDLHFYFKYKKKYKISLWDNPPHYYLRLIHGYNTWEENHFQIEKKVPNVWHINAVEKEYLAFILNKYHFIN